ncbi:reverse transcriptase domain-containing protein [Francisellaceae bacterium]|nr:reverse transcriptase domain-containing protein [Francisellaceae bacterium]
MHWLTKRLSDPETFYPAIDRAIEKLSLGPISNQTKGLNDMHFEQLQRNKKPLAKHLSNLIQDPNFDFSAIKARQVKRGNKLRTVYIAPTLEDIYESAVSKCLIKQLRDYGLPGVYGFFPGQSPEKALKEISKQLRQSERDRPWYVLRTDISNYTDSIPTDSNSPLWPKIENFLNHPDETAKLEKQTRSILSKLFRPIAVTPDGAEFQFRTGVPMGRPISTFIAALYLRETDIMMRSFKNAFYIRYGDDIIWMSTDYDQFALGNKLLSENLEELKLTRQPQKDQYIYLTRSGSKSNIHDYFEHKHYIEYLGLLVKRTGEISLNNKQISKLKKELRYRIKNLSSFIKDKNNSTRIQNLVNAVNFALTEMLRENRSKLTRLLSNTTDRSILKDTDYFIAYNIAMMLTNIRSTKCFREVSYKSLRNNFGLISLCQIKNNPGIDYAD